MHPISFAEAVRVWARIGFLSFGGPAGQVALMHKELVERRRWISEQRFLHALSYCMLLPGPEAQQLAIYVGWLMHRTPGGIVAGTLFVIPGFLTVLGLSILYACFKELPAVSAVFFGLKAAVLAVVIEALIRIGRRALRTRFAYFLAASAFVALCFFHVPFPLVILAAALVGLAGARFFPEQFPLPAAAQSDGEASFVVDELLARGELRHTRPSVAKALRVLVVCTALWAAPLLVAALLFGRHHALFVEGVFFSKAAMVTFGGAYAVLAYVAQRAVDTYGWLLPGEMLDGLGLAETTPGPLILVVEFVGFLGAFRNPGGLSPLTAGVLGASITVWVTFVPCFLWIFLGAPYIEALRASRALSAALRAVTAAVVGVILNLSVWFFVHTLFARVAEWKVGWVYLVFPAFETIDLPMLVLAGAAMLALLRFKLGMGKTLAISAAAGLLFRLLG
jgi:chromate transporter